MSEYPRTIVEEVILTEQEMKDAYTLPPPRKLPLIDVKVEEV